jgi:hypothetical protein
MAALWQLVLTAVLAAVVAALLSALLTPRAPAPPHPPGGVLHVAPPGSMTPFERVNLSSLDFVVPIN